MSQPGLPFTQLLSAERIERAFAEHGNLFGGTVYSTAIMVWSFLGGDRRRLVRAHSGELAANGRLAFREALFSWKGTSAAARPCVETYTSTKSIEGRAEMLWGYSIHWQFGYAISFWQVYATVPPVRRSTAELKRVVDLMNRPPRGLGGR